MRYGNWWRRHRKMFHQQFHPGAVRAFFPIQTVQTRAFLGRLLANPDDFVKHLRHLSGAIIMEVGLSARSPVNAFVHPANCRAFMASRSASRTTRTSTRPKLQWRACREPGMSEPTLWTSCLSVRIRICGLWRIILTPFSCKSEVCPRLDARRKIQEGGCTLERSHHSHGSNSFRGRQAGDGLYFRLHLFSII